MSIGKLLTEQLRLLTKEGPAAVHLQASDDRYKILSMNDLQADVSVTIELFDYDRYSLALRSLQIENGSWTKPGDTAEQSADAMHSSLSAQAAEIARRLSYLEEPLAVWEMERDELAVQLRSFPPQREDDEILYWEVTLHGGARSSARIARYRWAPGMVERELVAYPAAFALIARIADTLTEALQATDD